MDTSTPFTATQLILALALLGFLLIWMITFAVLALRGEKTRLEDLPISASSLPAHPSLTKQHRIASIPLELHMEVANPEPSSGIEAASAG